MTPKKTHPHHTPFGSMVENRSWSAGNGYRFGFNGQKQDAEVSCNDGDYLSFKYRMHDARLGRFLSVDPLQKDYPWNSPYAFAENRVIWAMELEGLEAYYTNDGTHVGQVGDNDEIRTIELSDGENSLSRDEQISNLKGFVEKANKEGFSGEVAQSNLMGVSNKALTPKVENDLNSLHPAARVPMTSFILKAKYELGVDLAIDWMGGYRTFDDQARIWGKGRSQDQLNKIGYSHIKARPNMKSATKAKPGQSNHNYGLAIDIRVTGDDPFGWFQDQSNKLALGELGEGLGLSWGGRWLSYKQKRLSAQKQQELINGGFGWDYRHFEMKGNNWRTLIKLPKDSNGYVILPK